MKFSLNNLILKFGLAFTIALITPTIFAAEELPKDLKWETNETDPEFSSPDAKRGGTYRTYMQSFPLTLRSFGPDSNGAFRYYLTDYMVGLVEIHPNTRNWHPALATHWAYGKDQKTLYFKLRKDATWSDGKPVTADDFVFTLELMRSKHIKAPWYNNHYTEYFDKIVKYDDHTIAVVGTQKRSNFELMYNTAIAPYPKHFYKLDKNFVKNYNWKIPPTTGPYVITKIKKGKSITLSRVKNWWANDKRYFRNRHNVDKIRVKVVRDQTVAFEHFKKGKLDDFALTIPEYWHKKSDIDEFKNGYIHKYWLYNDVPQPRYGVFINSDDELMKDKNVRLGFAHSLNIDKINKTILRGDYERLNHYSEGTGDFDNRSIKARPYDLKKADEYFTKAGWKERGADGIRTKNGQRLSIRLTTGAAHHKDRLVIIKEEAKKAGVEITLNIIDGAAAWKLVQEKKHQVHWSALSATLRPSYRQGFHSANAHKPQTNNMTNTDIPALDKLIDTYRNTFDDKKKAKLSQEILQIIHDDAAFIPTFKIPYYRIGAWRWMKFPKIPTTRASDASEYLIEGRFWIDEDIKKETEKAMKKGKKFKPVTVVDETYRVK